MLANVFFVKLSQFLPENFDDVVEDGLPHNLFDSLLVRQW